MPINLLQSALSAYIIFSSFGMPQQELIKPEVEIVHESIQTVTEAPVDKDLVSRHTVKKGETLREIAKEYFGHEKYWVLLFNDNPEISDPANINSGLTLIVRSSNIIEEEPNRLLPSPTQVPPTPTAVVAQSSSTAQPAVNTGGNFDQVYKDAGARFNVPWQVLLAIHRVETGQRDGAISNGSGPQGPMQFMPGTFAKYAVDGNGDGATDINSAVDAIHTAANYLSKHSSIEAGVNSYGRIIGPVRDISASLGYSF